MITKDDMMDVLVTACPSFAPQWQEFRDEWRDKADDLPLYLVLTDLARHLIALIDRGDTSEFFAVFTAVERLHIEGEHYVREAATVGLLEDLQNGNLYKNASEPEHFRPYLGPISERWWDKLYGLWLYGEWLTDD